MPKAVSNLEPSVKFLFLRDLHKDDPEPQYFEAWMDAKAGELGVESEQLRLYLAEQIEIAERGQRQAAGAVESLTQKVAESIGLSRAKILGRVNAALNAKKTILRMGHNGHIAYEKEVDDWDTVLAAAREGSKLLGAYAPAQYQVEHEAGPNLKEMSVAEIATRLLEIKAKLSNDPDVRAALAEQAETSARSLTTTERVAGSEGDGGHVLLADGSDPDPR